MNDAGGSGTQERQARFGMDLPNSPGLDPQDPRARQGQPVESPSRRNDYTAVVRIEDDEGGADNYEFELTWRN